MDISALDLFVEGFDIYWLSDKMDWMMEKNHEGYFCIYVEWLIKEIKKTCPNWEKMIIEYS